MVKISLEVQGGMNYFRIVEGTMIISCVSFFSLFITFISAAADSEHCFRIWTLSDYELWT